MNTTSTTHGALLGALLGALPARLSERCVTYDPSRALRDAGLVVYWMRTAARGHENPALDLAIEVAESQGLRLLVYHGVDERYPYASDRMHTFILQGARDVAAELAARGVPYALHVRREGAREDALTDLSERAALLVTEEMPTDPLRALTSRVSGRAPCPVVTVDTSCVVPMTCTSKAPERAFAFRKDTKRARATRLREPWKDATWSGTSEPPADLPFSPVDASDMDIPGIVALCDIDHGVAPVPDTPGGARAGYTRWERFVTDALKHYKRNRNDPAKHASVSRMSAYLHFGHVSPLRIAREAASYDHEGAEKYLDELITWRELAYHWCHHTASPHDTLDALPGWARRTLADHERDRRGALYTRERLSRAATQDPVWNLAQRSLLAHGELHNNFRMTWGKQLLSWTPTPRRALDLLVDLNHRYALDGRDPASYGGLLWCLGLFDRPHDPEVPVFGSVRRYETDHYGERLKIEAYREVVSRPAVGSRRVAVVGAGLSGAIAARTLADHGVVVTVLDKGYAPGGRMSSRRDPETGQWFDHGAPRFTARHETFRRWLRSWIDEGVVAKWRPDAALVTSPGHHEPLADEGSLFVATPQMHALVGHVVSDLSDVRGKTRVMEARRDDGGRWSLTTDGGEELGPFDAVVWATPAAQAAPLLERAAPELSARVEALATAQTPRWALMLTFDAPPEVDFDLAEVRDDAIEFVTREASKPGRESGERWVAHATEPWTRSNLEREREEVAIDLTAALQRALGLASLEPSRAVAHRWRYALGGASLPERCVWDEGARALACGDWCVDGEVEGAFLSGTAAAGRLLGWFAREALAERAERTSQPSLL